MRRQNTLLYPPSARFCCDTQRFDSILSAATLSIAHSWWRDRINEQGHAKTSTFNCSLAGNCCNKSVASKDFQSILSSCYSIRPSIPFQVSNCPRAFSYLLGLLHKNLPVRTFDLESVPRYSFVSCWAIVTLHFRVNSMLMKVPGVKTAVRLDGRELAQDIDRQGVYSTTFTTSPECVAWKDRPTSW